MLYEVITFTRGEISYILLGEVLALTLVALPLAPRELGREVARAVAEPHPLQGRQRLGLVGHRVEVLRQHHVLDRREERDHVVLSYNFV